LLKTAKSFSLTQKTTKIIPPWWKSKILAAKRVRPCKTKVEVWAVFLAAGLMDLASLPIHSCIWEENAAPISMIMESES
jgi:hypothetical protein